MCVRSHLLLAFLPPSLFHADFSFRPSLSPTVQFSPAGTATGTIIYSNLGCESTDFPSEVSGQIALVDRGTCEFGLKVALAGAAGATGIIIANNEEANPDDPPSAVTLGEPNRPEGAFVPAVSVAFSFSF
jgi:carboxypeptidase Q